MMNQKKIIQVMHQENIGRYHPLHDPTSVCCQMKGLYFQPNGSLPNPTTRPLGPDRRRNTVRAASGSTKLQKAFFKSIWVPYKGTPG